MDRQLAIIHRADGIRGVSARTDYLHTMMTGSGVMPAPTPLSRDVELGVFPSSTASSPRKSLAPPGPRPAWVRYPGMIFVVLVGVFLTFCALGLFTGAVILGTSEDGLGQAAGYAVGGAIVMGVGLTAIRLMVRPLLQFVLMLSGVMLAFVGANVVILAVLSEDRDFPVNETRAAILGATVPVIGLTVAAIAFVRWYTNPESRSWWPQVARWASVSYAVFLLLAGAAVVAQVNFSSAGDDLSPHLLAAFTGAAIPLGILPAGVLAAHGLTIGRYPGERPFSFPPALAALAALGATITIGAALVETGALAWLMTPAHALAALLPAAIFIAWASRGGLATSAPRVPITSRQFWLALAVGIAVVTALAAAVDSLIAGAMSLAVYVADGALDDIRRASGDYAFQNPDRYLSRGATILLVLGVVSFMVPIMEEGFKALGLSLILPRNATRATAFALGVIVGAGFGVTEASLYGLYGLDEGAEITWWLLMLVRAGATGMHALNTGLVGLALVSRDPRRILKFYLAAVALHGLWNGLAVLAGTRIIFSLERLTDSQLVALSLAVLAVLTLANLIIFSRLVGNVHRQAGAAPAGSLSAHPIQAATTE